MTESVCESPGCDKSGKLRRARGVGPRFCQRHYDEARAELCEDDECHRSGKLRRIGGLGPRYCQRHYDKYRSEMIRNGAEFIKQEKPWNVCAYPPCPNMARRRTAKYCDVHYQRDARVGDPGVKFAGHSLDCDCQMCLTKPSGTKWCGQGSHFVPVKEFHVSKHTCKECARWKQYETRYGLDRATIESMLNEQNWQCPIDGSDLRTLEWVVDHHHDAPCGCGKDRGCKRCVRSILCHVCNSGVGRAEQGKYINYVIAWQVQHGIFMDHWSAIFQKAVIAGLLPET